MEGQRIDTGAFVGADSRSAVFEASSFDLSGFLDDTGTVSLALDDVFAKDFFHSAQLDVSAAALTIEGTLVPEPSSGLRLAAGIAGLAVRDRHAGA